MPLINLFSLPPTTLYNATTNDGVRNNEFHIIYILYLLRISLSTQTKLRLYKLFKHDTGPRKCSPTVTHEVFLLQCKFGHCFVKSW